MFFLPCYPTPKLHVTREENCWCRMTFEFVESDNKNKGKACELCINKGMFSFVSNSASFVGAVHPGETCHLLAQSREQQSLAGCMFAWARMEAFTEYTKLLNCNVVTAYATNAMKPSRILQAV